ncbi:hypothetical protein F4777DRAFT_377803 [Nemania sp. FL0916]|nr:hypothetical protein F4777DRAFT_377803 [Nemania sp. FL0916]
MSQPHNEEVQDAGDEENCSNRATRGSSDPGSDTRSRSSDAGLPRPATRRPLQTLQTAQTHRLDTSRATQGISTLSSSSLRGLTPPPLPSAMLPSKKRSLGEVLGDESPPEKDKMSVEIDHLVGAEEPSWAQHPTAGSSGTQDVLPIQSHRRKRNRVSGEPSTLRAPLGVIRDSTPNSGRRGNRTAENHSENIRDQPRPSNSEASG